MFSAKQRLNQALDRAFGIPPERTARAAGPAGRAGDDTGPTTSTTSAASAAATSPASPASAVEPGKSAGPVEAAPAVEAAEAGRARGAHHHHVFELPKLPAMLLHALPRFVEGCIAPVAVFYAALAVLGLTGALVAAVTWVYGGICWRFLRGHPIPAVLMLAALGVTVRAGLAAVTHSAVVYFLQPTLGTLLVGVAFLASVGLRRPLAQKLATDMVPMPEAFLRHTRVRRFFLRISLLWSMVLFTNALLSLWMLLNQSIGTYLWVRTSLVTALGAAAVAVSVLEFKRCLRHVNRESTAA